MSNIELEDVACPICNSNEASIVISTSDLHFHAGPGIFNLVKCSSCNLLRTSPRPVSESMSVYYSKDYGPYKEPKDFNQKLVKSFKSRISSLFKFNIRYIPDIPKGLALEIGCSNGDYMVELIKTGWEVDGVEYDINTANNARKNGLNVICGQFENIELEKKYDLVVGWFVFEHLHDPNYSLSSIHNNLKKGGVVVFSIPNVNSLGLSFFGKYWYALQLPTHLFHYSPKTVKSILEKNDFHNVKIVHQRIIDNFWGSCYLFFREKNMLRLANIFKNIKEYKYQHHLMFPISYILSLFGLTGRMVVYANK